MIQQEIEDLLRQRIGLNPESVGSRSILRAVKKGMRTGKMQGLSDYLTSLRTSPSLFESLVESIVVPETSFFRNRASFVFLRQWLSQEWLPASRKSGVKRPLRVLSIPCSTGEEPYSIAITMLEEGLALDDFHIDAVDISALALAKAKEGVYSPYAFRRQTYRSDDKYFVLGVPEGAKGKRVTQRYFLIESVRQKISFIQGNVLAPGLLADVSPYDIVFCRNLLIYFDKAARAHVTALIDRVLKPHGLLFVGYAETGLIDLEAYKPVPYPQTFAYRKRADRQTNQVHPAAVDANNDRPVETRTQPELTAVGKSAEEQTIQGQFAIENNAEGQDADSPPALLAAARELADQGDVAQAVELCDRHLFNHPADAQTHLLRGELYAATGENAQAEACFKKAVYLDPHLIEALTHLMLLKDEQKDLDGVAIIQARLQRLATTEL